MTETSLDLKATLAGARLLVVGGTGFLGKVWLSMLLHGFGEQIEHIYLVVRPKPGLDPEARFWAEVAPSGAFDPLRQRHPGPAFEEFLRRRITPIAGDVSQPWAGLAESVRDKLRGTLTAMVNAAGVVDFNPPLDDALAVNAYGMQSIVALARDLADVPLMHTSTCYVAGMRTGQVEELPPLEFPFPKADELDRSHWDPDREIAECNDVIEHVRHRSADAFRNSQFLADAKQRLIERGEPARGSALQDELARVRRRYEEGLLADAGKERANFWGWPNTYTYTKSIGEQILADSGLTFCIVRPAVIESSLSFPRVGWNEGITTSAPIMYLAMKGMTGMPANPDSVLDVVPADTVAGGMILALAELLDGSAQAVYQLGTSDSNPLSMYRLIELTGLYKRRKMRTSGGNSPFLNWLQSNYQTIPVGPKRWNSIGPGKTRDRARFASGLLRKATSEIKLLGGALEPAARLLDGVANTMDATDRVVDQYVPFTATHNYVFSCRNARTALARVPLEQRALAPWTPEQMDWRHYWLEVHVPGVETYVWPVIEERIARPRKALRPHDDLVAFLDEIAERHEHAPALLVRHPDGFSRTSFRQLRDRARASARRLTAAGVRHGDRVLLAGANHPDWVVGYFGILLAGAVAVPLDPGLEGADAARIEDKAQPRVALLDPDAAVAFGSALEVDRLDLHATTAPGRADPLDITVKGDDVASILFTSGTTGEPKGVMLTHANFCSLLASLSRVFQLGADDRVLSVLPLHHTFEFTCGLLLPLSRGTRVVYLDEITGEQLAATLNDARITAMVGVPALWQLLERRMQARVRDQGPLFAAAFDAGLELNRWLGRTTGLDLGRILFGTVHKGLGGNIRLLISGGAALPAETHSFFAGLGLHLAEGYGLTEAAPVLTVDEARPGARPGTVGRAIPGVELQIADPDSDGVGEVLARGPNVMKGYFRDEASSNATVDADGWLHTGDLGRFDGRRRLVVVGRAKDVVVTASGENLYLDDLEAKLGTIPHVEEFSLVGLPDGRGGELLGLLAQCAEHSPHDHARDALRKAARRLPAAQRPALTYLVDAPLPRTATRKVKRREVRDLLERIHEATKAAERLPTVGDRSSAVRRAVAQVAGKDLGTLTRSARIADELGFDSLMWVELSAALDELPGGAPGADALTACETIADVEALVAAHADSPTVYDAAIADDPDAPADFRFPAPLVPPLRKLLRRGQRGIYESLLDVSVTGRALVPRNRQVLVVSNHCSHIDMGLAKTALGDYGEHMVALAAADYFFEGHPAWVAYFDQLTNLEPLARGTSYRQSLREAIEVVRSGRVVLIFPEGGRQADGVLKDFKPLIGKLVLETKIDVLPMYLWGSHDVLPKGSFMPRGRKVGAKIGPVVPFEELVRLSEGSKPSAAARTIAQVLHTAVRELRDGSALDLSTLESWDPDAAAEPVDPLADLFAELRERFLPDAATDAASWYFSLGGDAGRWTVTVEAGACTIARGKPVGGAADCVIKTSADLWTRMVREAYVPEVSEFVTGAIKTSDLNRLQAFAGVFRLGPLSSGGDPKAAGASA